LVLEKYEVRQIRSAATYEWLIKVHYAKRIPNITDAFGLFCDRELVGVITYGKPASPFLCIGVCGREFADHVYELNRVCLLNNKKNEASFFVAKTLRLLSKPRIIVSYADTAMDHVGKIYQACNFIYTGATKPRTDVDTGEKHSRHISGLDYSKRKNRSSKHRYVYFVGDKKQKKLFAQSLKYQKQPYPIGFSRNYETPTLPATQMELF